MSLSRAALEINPETIVPALLQGIRDATHVRMKRRGAVVAVSGGIDSSLCLALCAEALGRSNVLALLLPDKDSSADSTALAGELVRKFDVSSLTVDITPILESVGAYAYQTQAIREVFPDFAEGQRFKVVLPSILASGRLNISRIVVERPEGGVATKRMPAHAYLQLVAATNFKQRTRTMLAYFHADRLNYAVCGTPNRLEHDQGFFVKGGDGASDFKPIAHLFKTQVFALARYMGVPEGICKRTPTTDTYSLPQTQEEFYFALPHEKMDICLYGYNHGIPARELAETLDLHPDQVERVFHDIEAKRHATLPLHLPPILIEEVPEISRALKQGTER